MSLALDPLVLRQRLEHEPDFLRGAVVLAFGEGGDHPIVEPGLRQGGEPRPRGGLDPEDPRLGGREPLLPVGEPRLELARSAGPTIG